MTYFGDQQFAWVAAGIVAGAVLIRLKRWPIKYWLGCASLLLYGWIFGSQPQQLAVSLFFLAFQYGLIQYQLRYPATKWTVYLSFLPLVLTKAHEIWPLYSLGFVGISYLSFKAVQMLLETQDGLIEAVGLWDYLNFMLFFPAVSSGPIDRSRRFLADSERILDWKTYGDLFGQGTFRLLLGAVYKFVIATIIYQWMTGLGEGLGLGTLVRYAYGYTFYLFFDFAGYSLMAVGLSNLMGIETPMNFKQPFLAIDIKDFWNRWHITLSQWLRDFVFSRFMMSLIRKKRLKTRLNRAMAAYLVNMLFMGFWHGFSFHYILYGCYHGVLMAGFEFYQKKSKFYKQHKNHPLYRVASWAVTLQLVVLGMFIFSDKFPALWGQWFANGQR